ncbi:MAG: uroporphyrinogen-III C-methyltransferase [Acidobacteriia bacterium]|nr:uroporphyrinogen-III C-methyltransferase [Terriglobia bacterium]
MKVYLVGAGPGDPGLLTIKGKKILERADSILYDNLASDRLLDLAPASAERVYVGKKRAAKEFSQDEIAAMLVERARRGWNVVRLKGGDPFIFGRGGEEIEALAAANIPFEIVPGVTTPLGVAAYTGVPLTHREHTSAVTFVTGHHVEAIDWSKIGASETVVLFMGLMNFPAIAREMIARGRPAKTPAMAVRWATRPDQQTIVGTLEDLAEKLSAMKPPATIVIGEVVALRERFNWYERLPLFGKRIIVTRDRRQAAELADPLEALGAEVLLVPVIEIREPADAHPLDFAIGCLDTYDWLIFTSANGVRYFTERLDRSAVDLRSLKAKICAIGPATRAAVEALHLKVDKMPPEYVAESLLDAFASEDLNWRRILLPRAAVARDLVPMELKRRGAHVDVVEAYRTVLPDDAADRARAAIARKPDWITFTSSSTVTNFIEAAGKDALKGVKIASIGPITSETARQHGLQIHVEAKPHTTAGLIQAILG